MVDRPPVWMLGGRPAKLGAVHCWRCHDEGFVKRPCIACGRWTVAGGTVVNEQAFTVTGAALPLRRDTSR